MSGLDIAVATMRKGELSRFLLDSDYMWGKLGIPPRIPEAATSENPSHSFKLYSFSNM